MSHHTVSAGLGWIVQVWIAAGLYCLFYVFHRLGWGKWAETFPGGPRPLDGRRFLFRSGRVGWLMNYNNCLNVTVSREGVYVVPLWPFRLFHAPLLLPWAAMRSAGEKRLTFLSHTLLVFEHPGAARLTLSLPADTLPDIHALAGRADFSAPRSY